MLNIPVTGGKKMQCCSSLPCWMGYNSQMIVYKMSHPLFCFFFPFCYLYVCSLFASIPQTQWHPLVFPQSCLTAGRKLTIHSTARTMLSKLYRSIDLCNFQALQPPASVQIVVVSNLFPADAQNTQAHLTRGIRARVHITLLSVH